MSSVAYAQPRTFALQQQADHLIHLVSQDRDTAFHFWLLVQMRRTYPDLDSYLTGRSASRPGGSETADCLIRAVTSRDISMALEDAWKCASDPDLGVFALADTPEDARPSLIARNQGPMRRLLADPVASAHWDRIRSGGTRWPAALWSARPFRAADVLLLTAAGAPAEMTVQWARWDAALSPGRRNLSLTEYWQVFGLIDRLYQRNDYRGMVSYIPMLSGAVAIPDLDITLRTYRRLAFASYYLGHYQTALDFYRTDLLPLVARMAAARSTYLDAALRVEIDYGSILFRLGDIPGARDVYSRVYPRRDLLVERRFRTALLNNLAVTYLNSGMTDEYLELQLEALEEARAVDQKSNQLQILNNLYVFHWKRGDWENAALYLAEALGAATDMGSEAELANILTLYATYHREHLRDYANALQFGVRAIEILERTGNLTSIQTARFELALTLELMGKSEEAYKVYHRLMNDADARKDKTYAMQVRIQLADAYQRNERFSDADRVIQWIDDQADEVSIIFDHLVSRVNVQSIHRIRKGRGTDAVVMLEPLIDEIFERVGNSADAQTGFIRFNREYLTAIRLLTDLYLEAGRIEPAAELLDRVKSVNQAAFANSNLIRVALLSEADRLADFQNGVEIEQIRTELLTADATRRVELNNRLLGLQQQRNQRIRSVIPTLPQKPDVAVIRRNLADDEMAVSVTILDESVYRTVLTRKAVKVERISDNTRILDTWNRVMDEVLTGRSSLLDLYDVRKSVLGGLWTETDRPVRLVFVPDGPLHRIPIEILPTTKPSSARSFGTTRYLLEETIVRYATSLAEIHRIGNDRTGRSTSFLGVGNSRLASFPKLAPLPNAETEVRRIASRFSPPASHRTLLGAEATETNTRLNAATSRILHIASHSDVNMTDPLFSVVYLESDSLNDGAFYAYEWFGLDLANDLVMLSSCASAGGAYIQGSGMIGLARALRFAGAKSLVANTWAVRDQTAAEISDWFYEELRKGLPYDEALRSAKLRYLNSRNGDPHLWGSFILIGDNLTLGQSISIRTWFFGGVLMLIAMWVLYVLWRRQRLNEESRLWAGRL